MWLDCKIQLGERGRNSAAVLVRIDGLAQPVQVRPARIRYNPSDFVAEPVWGSAPALPSDCYQTGSGWVECFPAARSRNGKTRVRVPRLHELELIIDVPDSQLWDAEDVRQRLAA